MNFKEYSEAGYDLYAEFADTVASIISSAMEQEDTRSRLLTIQRRAKDQQSLRTKLEVRGILDENEIENRIKDLAGCRLIFYTNNDINKFLSSRLIVDNFNVDFDESNFHQPIDEQDKRYVATHYVVSLSDERLSLPEYAKFKGLRCEIQIQSILNHAWAETSHDIIYKSPNLAGFGSKEFQSIEERVQRIMTNYLLPAGYEFQKIEHDFERLMAGQALFDEGALEKLKSCTDNNERCELLERFRDYVLSQYDDVVAAFPDIRLQLVDVIEVARNTVTTDIETPVGIVPGQSYEQVTNISLEILERLQYVNVDEVFSALCQIYVGRKSDAESEGILKSIENLAGHNLEVWKQVGPYVQERICDRIQALDDKEVETLHPLILRGLSQVLSPEAKSTSSTYSSITLHRAPVQPSTSLTRVRNAAVSILEDMYSPDAPEQERRVVLSALWEATETSHHASSSEELDLTIIRNSLDVLGFCSKIAKDESFEVLQHLEHKAFWLFKRCQAWSKETGEHAKRASASQELIDSILRFRDQINGDQEFVIYKTLVGFESIFPPDWNEEEFDLRAKDAYRKEQIGKLLESAASGNTDRWRGRIIRFARTDSYDAAIYPYFDKFLTALVAAIPDVVIKWLHDLDENLVRYLPALLWGFENSDEEESVNTIIEQWISENRYLPSLTKAKRFSDRLDTEVLRRIADVAIDKNDILSINDVIAAVFDKCTPDNFSEFGQLGLSCIEYCTSIHENRWIHEAWIYVKETAFLELLEPDQIKIILDNLENANKIDFHVEELLTRIANNHIGLIVEFFGNRLRKDRDLPSGSMYEAIPYSFHQLRSTLKKYPELVVGLSRELFDEDDYLFEFRGGRFIRIVFPEFNNELEAALIAQAKNSGDAGVNFVLCILRNYKGEVFLHELIKEVICVLKDDDKRFELVEIALEGTGVVSGEFGMRDAYLQKKEDIVPWLKDKHEKVRLFAERYTRSLERLIAVEQKRAQEDIEMRKRDYGEGCPE